MNRKGHLLRDYQEEMITRIQEAWKRHRSVMAQMPTGTGKTHVLAAIVNNVVSGGAGKVLVVAHRRELISQIRETVDVFRSFASAQDDKIIKVESIQTIVRRIDSTFNFIPDLVIIDEAHHALAKTYRILWEKWPQAKFLGLTATPCRMNGTGFTDLFDELVSSWSISKFIEKGVLVSFESVSIPSDSEERRLIDGLRKRGADGDYLVKEMDEVLNKWTSIERLYRSMELYVKGKKGIVYAISISHARNIAAYYSQQGIKAVAIDSRTPKMERKRLVEEFKAGSIQVLVNVDIFSEGFDCPDVEFVQMARPTLSLSKYLQQVGRGLRKSEGKVNCMLIDSVGLFGVFGLPTQEWDWERMFRGELEAWQDVETGLWGLRGGNVKVTEPIYVRVFDIQGEWAAVRFQNNCCGWVDASGKVLWKTNACQSMKFMKNGFLEIVENGGKESYLDLYNFQLYAWKPEVKRYGNFELLKVRHRCYSRTQEVYVGGIDFVNLLIADKGFYLSVFESAGRYFCLLAGDEEQYYQMCRRLDDGSIVVVDNVGRYYHVVEGKGKVLLGRDDCRPLIDRLAKAVKKQLADVDEEKKRKVLDEYRHAMPYRSGMKWGLKVGNRITVPPIYRNIQQPVGKYCAVEMNYGQWGVIAIDGTMRIEPTYAGVDIGENDMATLTYVTGKKEVVKL